MMASSSQALAPGQRLASSHYGPVVTRPANVLGESSEEAAMAEAVPAGMSRPSRLDRRKARTRQALIDAAVRLIAEGRGDRASIQEITEAADIGFGSFYNHFDSKDQLFTTASGEVLERWGQMIDGACAGISDPAEVFACLIPDLRAAGLDQPRHSPVPHRRRAGPVGFRHRARAPRPA